MTCYIYRCSAKADMYIYLRERDDYSCLPPDLSKHLGRLDFSMQLEIHADKKLARENPLTIIDNLKKQGFHLQMPGDTAVDELLTRIANEQNVAAEKSLSGK
ncbi:MAG: YcgL domain-containing protein [Gammaproteobacteria bacterium]|nr:YcgL domain-containing protein [Gammaproteobacteria bacterium]